MRALVEIHNLKRYFRLGRGRFVHAVDDVSLHLEARQTLGLVGESGSGKSTLGKTLLGLLDKTAGKVVYSGEELPTRYRTEDHRRYSDRMQMIFQDPYSSLNPRMTVAEIIAEGPKLQGKAPAGEIRDAVAGWLRKVGLEPDHMSRYPHEFSGGQRQRIGIARAMIMKPEFVVCDEPISALDVSVQAQVINLMDDLKKSSGLTMLFIAHDLSMVRHVSDRMAVMYLGALMEVGPSDDLFYRPMHPYSKVLAKSNPQADPRTEKTRAHEPIQGEIPSAINVPEGCRFASRCPHVMHRCRMETPNLISIVDEISNRERQVACHLFTTPGASSSQTR